MVLVGEIQYTVQSLINGKLIQWSTCWRMWLYW